MEVSLKDYGHGISVKVTIEDDGQEHAKVITPKIKKFYEGPGSGDNARMHAVHLLQEAQRAENSIFSLSRWM